MRQLRRIPWLTAALLLSSPVAALAEGMPQLDFKNPLTVDQVWWGAVIFVVFLLLCWLWGLPLVANVLERRSAAIAADLDSARTMKAEADRSVAEMTAAITTARAEAQAAINRAVETAREQTAGQAAELNARLEAQLRDAEGRIEAARQGAMRALRQVATDTATAMVARLTGAPPAPARLERAVGAALAVRGQA